MTWFKGIECGLLVAFLACQAISWGQDARFPALPADDPAVATVLFHPAGQPLAPPVVPLDQGMLELRLDDLSGDYTAWEVRVRHCDRFWAPSDPVSYTHLTLPTTAYV